MHVAAMVAARKRRFFHFIHSAHTLTHSDRIIAEVARVLRKATDSSSPEVEWQKRADSQNKKKSIP